VKISFEKDQGHRLLPHAVTVPRRSTPKSSIHNLQLHLEKSKNPHFENQAYWGNGMVKGKIRDPARKPLPKKENLREGSLGVIE